MKLCNRLFDSPIGAKMLMAVTGLLLTGFVLMHMSGNLLLYAGEEKFNAYAQGMQSLGALLWIARAGLLATFLLHLALGFKVTLENKAARPIRYAHETTIQATYASRHMIHTGCVIFAFILFHLAHYTFKITNPEISALQEGEAYKMVVIGFSDPITSLFYVLAMAGLSIHLKHGISSLFQSLGLYHGNLNPITEKLGPFLATVIFVGFTSIPLSVLVGIIK